MCVKKMNNNLRTGVDGINIIKFYEGFRPNPYLCPSKVPTIGYGTTMINNKKIDMKMPPITESYAHELLVGDVREFEDVIKKYVKVPLSQSQFDALVSFVYNIGSGNFKSSTLLRLLNLGKYEQVRTQLMRWNKSNGKVLSGLTKRRHAEANLFESSM